MSDTLTPLIQRLRTGDEKAFRQIYDLYAGRLQAFAIRIVKSPVLAEDLIQDIFVNLWELRESLDPEKNFQSFLFTITRNHALNLLKRSSANTLVLNEIFIYAAKSSNTTEDLIEFDETSRILHQALDQLPPQQKRVFELCKLNGLSYEQAAAELNISPGTINAHMVKSIRFIKTYLSRHENVVAAVVICCLL